jgi:hypothetical protein
MGVSEESVRRALEQLSQDAKVYLQKLTLEEIRMYTQRYIFSLDIYFNLYRYIFGGRIARYSDWLWAGLLRCQISSPGRGKIILSMSSRLVLGRTQPPSQ